MLVQLQVEQLQDQIRQPLSQLKELHNKVKARQQQVKDAAQHATNCIDESFSKIVKCAEEKRAALKSEVAAIENAKLKALQAQENTLDSLLSCASIKVDEQDDMGKVIAT